MATCGCCGQELEGLVRDFGWRRPMHYFMVPEDQRARRVRESDDLCVIDDKIFLIRGIMKVPILEQPGDAFGWGFWVAVSKRSFDRYLELYEVDGSQEPPFRGLLAVSPPNYPDALDAPVTVHLGAKNERPELRPMTFEHPLFAEQRDGISVPRWHRIVREIQEWQARGRP